MSRRVQLRQVGNELIKSCKSAVRHLDEPSRKETMQEAYDIGFCEGLVTGVANSASLQGDVNLAGTSRDQLVRVVQKYLEDHPEELNRICSWLVHQALVKAFPKVHGGK